MTNTTFPRRIQFDNVWPATEIRSIGPATACRHCGQAAAYFHGDLGKWAHVATERTRCAGIDGFQLAEPAPTCPACGGHDLAEDHTDPWADITTCPCGWSSRRSLGD